MIHYSKKRYAVIGGDGMLGHGLVRFFRNKKKEVIGTSRRRNRDQGVVFLDFVKEDSWGNILNCTDAIIVGGVTDYGECKNNPEAMHINEECIPQLALFLSKNNIRVSFVSSNTVFSGKKPWPEENAPHCPVLDYGQQKSNAERHILQMTHEAGTRDLIKVIRITKILTMDTRPIPDWINAWSRAQQVDTFEDLVIAPVTLGYIVNYLSTIVESQEPGCYHISGSENINYFAFGKLLAKALGHPLSLVNKTTSIEVGVEIPYLPTYAGLGMNQTTKMFGIESQTIKDVVKELCK
jgi:dTDP-4-dehydrorhamnose reductase